MKLAVCSWSPYQHQATALGQLVGNSVFERVALETVPSGLHDASLGPYLLLIDPSVPLPIAGLPAIVEALHRKYGDRGFLPAEAIARARVRALTLRIEESFSRLCVADIANHKGFQRRVWAVNSQASTLMREELPGRLSALERYQEGVTSRFIVGDRPTLADCFLAALWWTAEDQGLAKVAADSPWLASWHARNCSGNPFSRAGSAGAR